MEINQFDDNSEKHGYWETLYENGNIEYKVTYKHGMIDGVMERNFHNGNIWYRGNFKDDERVGLWEHYGGREIKFRQYYLK